MGALNHCGLVQGSGGRRWEKKGTDWRDLRGKVSYKSLIKDRALSVEFAGGDEYPGEGATQRSMLLRVLWL